MKWTVATLTEKCLIIPDFNMIKILPVSAVALLLLEVAHPQLTCVLCKYPERAGAAVTISKFTTTDPREGVGSRKNEALRLRTSPILYLIL